MSRLHNEWQFFAVYNHITTFTVHKLLAHSLSTHKNVKTYYRVIPYSVCLAGHF